MSRYNGPRLRICRRLGELPGLSRKTSKKKYRPGEHINPSRKLSEYAVRLEEKQKLRFNYGLSERQLLRYVKKAKKITGSTGQILLQILEMRLDNTIFRLGMASTIPASRQLINHRHILVNNKVVSICSYQCKLGDIIMVKDQTKSKTLVRNNLDFPSLANIPPHLELDRTQLIGRVKGTIDREWITLQLNELLIVEFYSKR